MTFSICRRKHILIYNVDFNMVWKSPSNRLDIHSWSSLICSFCMQFLVMGMESTLKNCESRKGLRAWMYSALWFFPQWIILIFTPSLFFYAILNDGNEKCFKKLWVKKSTKSLDRVCFMVLLTMNQNLGSSNLILRNKFWNLTF